MIFLFLRHTYTDTQTHRQALKRLACILLLVQSCSESTWLLRTGAATSNLVRMELESHSHTLVRQRILCYNLTVRVHGPDLAPALSVGCSSAPLVMLTLREKFSFSNKTCIILFKKLSYMVFQHTNATSHAFPLCFRCHFEMCSLAQVPRGKPNFLHHQPVPFPVPLVPGSRGGAPAAAEIYQLCATGDSRLASQAQRHAESVRGKSLTEAPLSSLYALSFQDHLSFRVDNPAAEPTLCERLLLQFKSNGFGQKQGMTIT